MQFKSKIRSYIPAELVNGIIIGLFLFFIYVFAVYFGPTIYLTIYTNLNGHSEIDSISLDITQNETDTIEIIHKIADWENINIEFNSSQAYYWPFKPFILYRASPSDSRWTLVLKKGACEEYAVLFNDLACNSEIESRVVYNTGEDHVWDEVLINGSWIHFDSTLSYEKRFDNPEHYEKPQNEGGWGKQISYVYTYDSMGEHLDITPTYTETGLLVVYVEKDGNPAVDCKVILQSKFLMETRNNYKAPRYACENWTDSQGFAVFNVGMNNYSVIAETDGLLFYRGDENATVVEHEQTNITIKLKGPRIRNIFSK